MPIALLTGATGLIGGEVCRLLLAQGWGVIALARSEAPFLGNDGVAMAEHPYGGGVPMAGEIRRLAGDIEAPHCGLCPKTIAIVAAQVDLVIHCAASTAFNASEEYYDQTNVAGTAHVLSLGGDKPFLHISTAYVCGRRDGLIAEASCFADTVFANGYERSKAAAEALVEQSGRPWLIARPSIVVGSSTDGRIRRFDSIYGAFKLMAEGRVKTIPAITDATFNFVPIDHVAEGILALAVGFCDFAGDYVHLCANKALPVTDFVQAISAFPRLAAPRLVTPHAFDSVNLSKMERLLFDRMLKHYLPYFQRSPDFVVCNLDRLTGIQSPVVDADGLHRLIGYAVNAGFVDVAKEKDVEPELLPV